MNDDHPGTNPQSTQQAIEREREREREMFLSWNASKLRLILSALLIASIRGTSQDQVVKEKSCPDTCGEIQIPYPFGIGKSCSLSDGFNLVCNNSNPNNLRPFQGIVEIKSIDLESSKVEVMMFMSYQCYNASGIIENNGWTGIDLNDSPFSFSYTENMFTAIGCDTWATITGLEGRNFTGGCMASCYQIDDRMNDTCSGIGCCQTSIPQGMRSYSINFGSWKNHSGVMDFNPCSYGFIVEKDLYNFSNSNLRNMDLAQKFPLVLDWAVGNLTCVEARKNTTEYACVAENSYCQESTNGPGYFCKCQNGYSGNPYLQSGCQDIDECKEGLTNCKGDCVNTNGSYTCTCPPGTTGNATGEGCKDKADNNRISIWAKLGLGIGIGLPLLFLIGSWVFWMLQKRKLTKLKEEFFRQNGGFFLQEKISSNQVNTFTIFSIAEMEKATNNFDEQRILGKGGNGIVYKGFLHDGRTIAIKKSMMVEASKSKEFANEMLILSQINHVNVVKLLGCCLEVEIPMLVYEYIPNGTLFQHINSKRQEHQMPWELRLKIAAQSAKALSYLHSEASPPILHGDIKSSNILLDENFTAKVSDFGTSTFAPKDKSKIMTLIQGTYGYLDPEYLQTGELTEKSDVYSFGVVMVELLTGKKAVYNDKTLASEFISCMKDGRLFDILDPQVKEGNIGASSDPSMEDIKVVADVAMQCLSVTGQERPTITQVQGVLQGLRRSEMHPWAQQNMDEMKSLLTEEQQLLSSYNLSTNEYPGIKSQLNSTAEIEITNIGRGR